MNSPPEAGHGIPEYVLMAALLAFVILAILELFGGEIGNVYSAIAIHF